jgi:ADP-L-glycero-D-manno-heptose 6-epimerase
VSDRRYIVTGGAGFIGSNIVLELNRRGEENIIIVDNLNSELKKKNLEGLKFQTFSTKDDFRKDFLHGKIPEVSSVFHMGACSSTTETDEEYLKDNNYMYTRQLCEWSIANGSRFIYASSAATYGDGEQGYNDDQTLIPTLKPMNPYGASKQMFDMWALENDLFSLIAGIKFFNVYGPREDHKGDMRSVVNKAYKQIKETGIIKLFKSYKPEHRDGEQTRDFVFVRDAVNVCMFFHDNPVISGIFNCGTGKART